MRDQHTHERLKALRQQEQGASLSEAERLELEQLLAELDASERASLSPATARLQRERCAVEAENAALGALVRRREKLAVRLEQVLTETRAERRAIQQELDRILVRSGTSSSTVL